MILFLFPVINSCKQLGAYLPAVEPVPESSVSTVEVRTLEDRERWWKRGLKAISEGKLAVVLLSGGQVRSPINTCSRCSYAYMFFLTFVDSSLSFEFVR